MSTLTPIFHASADRDISGGSLSRHSEGFSNTDLGAVTDSAARQEVWINDSCWYYNFKNLNLNIY